MIRRLFSCLCAAWAMVRGFFAAEISHECLYQQTDCQKGMYCPWCERDVGIGEYRR